MEMTIIGCGNMGAGLAKCLSKDNQLYLYDRHLEKTRQLEQEGYGKACKDIDEGLQTSEIIILAIKPQNLKDTASVISKALKKEQILVSLLAGTSINTLKNFFSNKIVRMMPNLALIYGEGVIGLSSESTLFAKDKERLTHLFQGLGKIHWIPEEKINALTALTGSGPAFFFVMVEAMIDAAVAMGFTAKDAQPLVHQMLLGSLCLLEKTSKHPGELKWQIASPQGTTISGLKKLEEEGLRGSIMNTFLAAYDRANQLSSNSEK